MSPRHILRQAETKLKEKGYDAKVGLEFEFYLYEFDEELLRARDYRKMRPFGWDRHAYSLNRTPNIQPFGEELIRRMADIGITIEVFHTEYGVGMYECTTAPMSPMEAGDAWVRFKSLYT